MGRSYVYTAKGPNRFNMASLSRHWGCTNGVYASRRWNLILITVNVRGLYHKDGMPKSYLRLFGTLTGLYFVFVGIHRLGLMRF